MAYALSFIPDSNGRGQVNMVSEPSLNFSQSMWWDTLLQEYMSPESIDNSALVKPNRSNATLRLHKDIRFFFRASSYWLSFFHVPRFFAKFHDPIARAGMQPSLILAMCALSTFWQSSEIGRGGPGRDLALKFRDEAQSAIESSVNAGWFTEELAQAAWVNVALNHKLKV